MRVRFKDRIEIAKRITYRNGSTHLIIVTLYDTLYAVECGSVEVASMLYEEALTNGYIDVSECSYSD